MENSCIFFEYTTYFEYSILSFIVDLSIKNGDFP